VDWTSTGDSNLAVTAVGNTAPELLEWYVGVIAPSANINFAAFQMDLNDASQVTATLYHSANKDDPSSYAAVLDSGNNVGSLSLTVTGQTEWTLDDPFDESLRYQMVLDSGHPGAVEWTYIHVDYTLTDGSTGSFDSSNKLLMFGGAFFEPWPGEEEALFGNGQLDSSWRIDATLAPQWDASGAVTLTSATLFSSGGESIDLGSYNPELIVSGGPSAGFSASGLSIDTTDSWTLGLTLTYVDDDIEWEAYSYMPVAISSTGNTAPEFGGGIEWLETDYTYDIFFSVITHDAVTITSQPQVSGSESGPYSDIGSGETYDSTVDPMNDWSGTAQIPSGSTLADRYIRIAITYTLPNGSSGTIYSEPSLIPGLGNEFLHGDYGDYDADTSTVESSWWVNTNVIPDPANVQFESAEITNGLDSYTLPGDGFDITDDGIITFTASVDLPVNDWTLTLTVSYESGGVTYVSSDYVTIS
jgi:hypothetical protein